MGSREEIKLAEKRKSSPLAQVLAVVVVVVIAIYLITTCNRDHDTSNTSTRTTPTTTSVAKSEARDIRASVSFDGSQFTITNEESRDWVNVRFEINPGLISSGYTLKVQRVEANTTYTVGAMQFTNADGERFNPFTHKPQSFNIIDFSTTWPDQYDIEGFSSYAWN